MHDAHWTGSLTIGTGWALFVGIPGESSEHTHHAWQLCVASETPFELAIASSSARRVLAAAIPNGRPHAVSWGRNPGALVYVEPESDAGRALAATLGDCGGAVVPNADLAPVQKALRAHGSHHGPIPAAPARTLRDACLGLWVTDRDAPLPAGDPRVTSVCERIRTDIGEQRLPARDLARSVGLSPSRLAAIFRTQAGIAMRPFILWTRLERAIAVLAGGRSATDAALEAGFSDAAHLARTFRRMFGTSISRGLGQLDIELAGP